MSGFEIAGVVLAAFPIVMSSSEKYRQAFEPLKSWWEFRRSFEVSAYLKVDHRVCPYLTPTQDFINNVGTQRTKFDHNLELLLSPFIESETHMGIILSDPSGEAWKDKKLNEKLRLRLSSSYQNYTSIVLRMIQTLKELQALLGLNNGQVRCPRRSSW